MAENTRTSGSVDISINVGARLRAQGIATAKLTAGARSAIWEIVEGLAFQLGEFVDFVWPVDTGASQADWDITAEGLEWTIRNPREYAAYVHRADTSADDLVYLKIAAKSEELLSGAWSQIKSAVETTTPSTSGLLGRVGQFLLPSIVGQAESPAGTLFQARAAGFLRQNTRSRERERLRAR
jgi:hypothetical protein